MLLSNAGCLSLYYIFGPLYNKEIIEKYILDFVVVRRVLGGGQILLFFHILIKCFDIKIILE